MNCLVCNKSLESHTPLCEQHAPACGKFLHYDGVSIFVGELGLFGAIVTKLFKEKLIRWWVGTDVLLLHSFPPGRGKLSVLKHRLVYHLTKFLVDENWLTGETLRQEFIACGGKRTLTRYHIRGMLTEPIRRLQHLGVNIGYYDPSPNTSARWKYGIDLVEKLMTLFPSEINWIKLDGTFNMKTVYPLLDGIIRPSRHDGYPRMILECQLNSIPYYYSENRKPDLDEMVDFIQNLVKK